MSTFNEKNWQAEKEVVARKYGSDALPGLLKKYLKVPPLTKALVTLSRGKKLVKCEGDETSGPSEAVLVKTRKFDLEFIGNGLVTGEGYVGDCRLVLTLMAAESDFDVEQVAENLLKGKDEVRIVDIHTFLDEAVRNS